jgi:hypothetical protein
MQIDTTRPAPKKWRKFENAYIMIIAPALGGAIQGWDLGDKISNRCMIIIGISVAIVKAVGFLVADDSSNQTA